ncbi:MAG: ABC transporter ATP-binding protein [Hyphomicrobiales bacterium]
MLFEQNPENAGKARPRSGWGARGTAGATIAARLTFDHVGRRFGETQAVSDLTLDVAPGQIVCLLGPSGCGKTTLLRLTAGLERPTAGRILINDREVAGGDRFVPPEQRGVGLMFQDFALFPHLTLTQNVAFGLKALGRSEARKVARAAIERVGLARYAEEYPHILSGGEQQRIALARAIAPRPAVLLMDEPFSGLDTQLRETMREETLAILKETRATCMIVTHSPEEAMQMGNRIALMRAGRLVQEGTAEELYYNPADIGAARMFAEINEIPATVSAGKAETPLGAAPAPGMGEGEAAIQCVRQRDVRVVPAGQGRTGRVLAARFLGETALLEIAVEGLDKTLLARVRESETLPRGTEVGVAVDTQSLLVFPASGGGLEDG